MSGEESTQTPTPHDVCVTGNLLEAPIEAPIEAPVDEAADAHVAASVVAPVIAPTVEAPVDEPEEASAASKNIPLTRSQLTHLILDMFTVHDGWKVDLIQRASQQPTRDIEAVLKKFCERCKVTNMWVMKY